MRLVRTLVVVVVGLGLVAAAPSAEAKKAKKEHPIKGKVASVEKDKDKDSGTITVHIAEHKNKKTNETKPAEDKTVKVTKDTKFIKVTGKKGDVKEEPATFADVKDGENVVVKVEGETAVEVAIHPHHKKKNA